MLRLLVLVWGALGGVVAAVRAVPPDTAFWVWNRAEALTSAEHDALRAAGVGRLYWQAGELELHGGELVFRRTASLPPAGEHGDMMVTPVVRVSTAIRSPEQFTGDVLGRALRPVADAAPGRELQLDFDCPDHVLPVYAERLRTARQVADIRRLTITALAGWADAPAAASLWPAVDAVYPMLYDTRLDPPPRPGDPSPCQPQPLLDPAELGARLRSWGGCPVPWYAGLPVFARVTLYDAAGRAHGHLRSWDWEDLVFNPALALDRPPAGGTAVLRALRPTRAGESPLTAGEYAAVRTAPRETLRAGMAQARAAGARGVVLFRLPDPPSPTRSTGGGWSLAQALALCAPGDTPLTPPRLSLRRTDDGSERWTLRNESDTDLPPRFAAPGRGYGLELEIADGSPGWREALPGDFHRVAGHVFQERAGADPKSGGGNPVPVAIPLARRLTFWFAQLPAHGALTTGLVQFAPGTEPAAVRFRLPADSSETSPWQSPD